MWLVGDTRYRRRSVLGIAAALAAGRATLGGTVASVADRIVMSALAAAAAELSASLTGNEYPAPLRTVNVSTRSELDAALANAQPGDHIVLADGSYGSIRLAIDVRGTSANPVVIRAANKLGAALPGGFDLSADSRYVMLWGLNLDQANSLLRGVGHVIRRCYLRPNFDASGTSIAIAASAGSDCRIDYCDLVMYTDAETGGWNSGALQSAIRQGAGGAVGNMMIRLTIHRCKLVGGQTRDTYSAPYGGFITTAQNVTESEIETEWTVRYCWGAGLPTRHTIIEAKSSKNTFEYLHISTSSASGYVACRQGHQNTLRGCSLDCHARIFRGPSNNVHSCSFSNNRKLQIMAGIVKYTDFTNDPPQAYKTLVSDIKGPNASIIVGEKFNSSYMEPALGSVIEAVEPAITYKLHQNTTVRSSIVDGPPPIAPVTLTANDVGVDAPWQGEN